MNNFTLSSREGKLILVATILASGMAFLDGSIVNIAVPMIQFSLHATISDIQWLINGYMLMLASLILIAGALGDKLGRKKIFIMGIGLFTFSSVFCGLSQDIHQLIASRFLQGIGGAMMIPGSLSIIYSSFKESIRGNAIGLWSGMAGGIAAIGPLIGGFLIQTFGWQAIFYINVPIGLIAFLITLYFVPETNNIINRQIDIWGTALVFFTLLFITFAFITGPINGWLSVGTLLSLIFGIILMILFIIVESKVSMPVVPFDMFKSSLVKGANLATLFLYFTLSGVFFFFVLNLQQIQHFSPLNTGLAMLPFVLIITFLSGYGGKIADRIGPRLPMIIGPFIVAIGIFVLSVPGLKANYFLGYLPGLVLFGLGMSVVIAPLTKSALSVDSMYSGVASGFNNSVSRIAGILGVVLLGAIILPAFTFQLNQNLNGINVSNNIKQQLLFQSDKLAAIQIPENLNYQVKQKIKNSIEVSYLYGFRIILWISSVMALIAGIISYLTIHNEKSSKNVHEET